MDLKRKYELIEAAILSLADHDDEDSTVRLAGLDSVIAFCNEQKTAIATRNDSRAAGMFTPGS